MKLFSSNSKLPSLESTSELYNHLIYSSKGFVDQTYYELYGNKVRKNVSEQNYVNSSVLLSRINGEGIDENLKLCDIDMSLENEKNIPLVGTVSGDLTIEVEDITDMCVSKIETSEEVYESHGSFENYHPLIQEHLKNQDEYFAGEVWATFKPVNDNKFHFNQIVQKSIFDKLEN